MLTSSPLSSRASSSSVFSNPAQSTWELWFELLLSLRGRSGVVAADELVSSLDADVMGLRMEDVQRLLPWLLLSWMPLRISTELGREDILFSSTVISGWVGVSGSLRSLMVSSATDNGTETMESVGSGWLSTWLRGARSSMSEDADS